MSALRISNEERAQRDALDALLVSVAPPPVITDKATLEDMLAEGETVRRRGRTFVCLPPSIKDLAATGRLMEAIQAESDTDKQLAIQFQIAAFVFWVQEGETLRPATRDDLEPCWSLGALTQKTLAILQKNGMETDPKNV